MIVASTKKVGYRLSILSTLSVYSVRRVFPLVLSKIFPFFSSVHLCASILSRLPSLESPLDPTRHALYVQLVPLLSLFCMPNERHTWAAGEWDIKRGRKVLKRHKGRPHALKGNDAPVMVVIVMVVVWAVVADSPLTFENSSCHATPPLPTFFVERGIMFYSWRRLGTTPDGLAC